MDINFLPGEDRGNGPDREKKEHRIAKEETKWSSPRETGETKNKLAEKKGVKKYLPDFGVANFFKKKNEDPSRLADAKKIKESRKELLKFVNQQKTENQQVVPLKKEEAKKETPKNKKNWIKLPNLSGLLSSFSEVLKKAKGAGPKGKAIRVDFFKARDEKIEEKKTEGREKKEKEISLAEERKSSHALETNLIKDEIIVFFDWKKGAISLSICILSVALTLGAVYGLLSWQASEKEKESQVSAQRFVEIDKEIKTMEKEVGEAIIFKKKLSLVNSILSQHIYWTNFFEFLEKNTLANVYYLGFTGDNKGKYSLSVNAKDFSSIEAQVKKFLEDKRVFEASVSQAAVSTTGGKTAGESASVSFELRLAIDPSIFTK